MTKDEALRLALKTLEYAGPSWIEARQPAITAIKEALAQPKHCSDCGQKLGDANHIHTCSPQRTWVGLTDEDRLELAKAQHGWEDLCLAVEAKLKAKNS
jgi:hypothetical protein